MPASYRRHCSSGETPLTASFDNPTLYFSRFASSGSDPDEAL
jgi:hypothetical protein